MLLLFCTNNKAYADEGKKSVELDGKFYEMSEFKVYQFGADVSVDKMSYGDFSAGRLVLNGNISEEDKKINNISAIGVTGNIAFSYNYDSDITNSKREGWYIVSDREKKFLNRKFDSDIFSGVMLIQKSYDGVHYEDAVNPVFDFFNQNTSGITLYTSAGEDITKGVYYRFIIAYKSSIDGKGILREKMRHMEVYDCYVVENSGTISIHNLSVDTEQIKNDEYSQELLKHGETLVDQSVTRDGFQIEPFASSYNISIQKDNGPAVLADPNLKYKEDGKYLIKTTTKLGKEYEQIVYVFSGGPDKGYSTYFGDGFIQGERVFREGSIPTYARGSKVRILKVDNNTPPLIGELRDAESGRTLYTFRGIRDLQSYPLEPGVYTAELYNGDKDAVGSIYQYTFSFKIIDEDALPYVNHHTLETREELKDLQSKHYEVAYPTTAGGFIFVCFDLNSYDEALKYAREIERRFVEPASDGGFYYKSEQNPNHKVKYIDQMELTRVRDIYAKKNVEIDYFNPLDQYTYRTFNNDLLECLEDLNTSESLKVFPSQEEKEKLIDRVPYINDFIFMKAADYDVVGVTAECMNNGEIISDLLEKPIEEHLKETSVYKIIETNKYGHAISYNAVYVDKCQTKSKWLVHDKGQDSTVEISTDALGSDNKIHISADAAYVTDISNEYDEWSIVTIKAPDVYSFELKCLTSELKDLELDKAGVYSILFIRKQDMQTARLQSLPTGMSAPGADMRKRSGSTMMKTVWILKSRWNIIFW